jgi:hypothetical protein
VCFLDSSILSVNYSYYVIVRPVAITGVSYRLNDAWLVPDKLKTTSGYITSTVLVLHSNFTTKHICHTVGPNQPSAIAYLLSPSPSPRFAADPSHVRREID